MRVQRIFPVFGAGLNKKFGQANSKAQARKMKITRKISEKKKPRADGTGLFVDAEA